MFELNIFNESYTPIKVNKQDAINAETKFKSELSHEVFDLNSFHIAYDSYFEKDNLLGLFNDDGKLIDASTQATILGLKNDNRTKALKKLWQAQFKNETEFLNDKNNRETITKEVENKKVEIKKKLRDEITSLSIYNKFQKLYNNKINLEITVYTNWNTSVNKKGIPYIDGAVVKFNNALCDADTGWFKNEMAAYINKEKALDFESSYEEDEDSLVDRLVSDASVFMHQNIKTVTRANLAFSNLQNFYNMPEIKELGNNYKIVYIEKNNVIYTPVERRFSTSKKDYGEKGLVLVVQDIDQDSREETEEAIDNSCTIVMIGNRENYTGKYHDESILDLFFKSKYKNLLEQFHLGFPEYNYTNFYLVSEGKIADTDKNLPEAKFFDKHYTQTKRDTRK